VARRALRPWSLAEERWAGYRALAMRRHALVSGLAIAVGSMLFGCSGEPPKTALGYTENAKRAYDVAMSSYRAHQFLESQNAFREVKRKYSYSKYARLAELRIADIDFDQEKFSDAIREYKDFIHAHRSDDEDVAYARSRIAEGTVKEIPEGFLMAASEERDQASVVDAYKELKSYLTDYPNAKQAAHVRELLALVVTRLIRHELYVARFYLNKENYNAAIARIQYALTTYPEATGNDSGVTGEEASLEADALVLLGETYLKMHKWGDARQAFEAVVEKHGRSAAAGQARNYLEHLRSRGA
jgi:outer membrane protein assembly factor BamD